MAHLYGVEEPPIMNHPIMDRPITDHPYHSMEEDIQLFRMETAAPAAPAASAASAPIPVQRDDLFIEQMFDLQGRAIHLLEKRVKELERTRCVFL
jgi:hypothetical protein